MKPSDRNSLHRLLSAVVDGTATQADADDLSRMLATDAEARRFYVRYLDMHADLTGSRGFEQKRSRSVPWAAAVALALFAASLAFVFWSVERPRNQGVGPASQAYVATVTACTPSASLNDEPVAIGMRVAPGRFHQEGGSVELRFDGGARILFDGEASFAIESRQAVAIDKATFVFRGDKTCESISVSTPHSVLTDIGTRYAAVVAAAGEELHVADGSVRRITHDRLATGSHEMLERGEGRRYTARAPQGAEIPIDERLVDRSLPHAMGEGGDPSALLAWDDFRVAASSIDRADSGGGWIDAWVSHRSFPELAISPRGLTADGSGAVWHEGEGWTAAHRRLQQPIDLSKDGVYYVRFLFRRGARQPDDQHLAMLVLRTYGRTTQEEIEAQSALQFAVSGDDTATIRFAGRSSRSSLPQSPDTTYAAVAKIVAGRTNPDQVFLRIMSADRLADSPEPLDWSVASASIDTDILLDQVSLEFVSAGRIELGNLCIGPSWESIVGPTPDAR